MKKWISGMLAFLLALTLLLPGVQTVSAAESMKSSQAFIDVLKKMEGFRAIPYWDHSQWTVGYGTRCPDDKLEEYKSKGITVEAAEVLLQQELGSFEAAVNSFAAKHNLTFSQHQFDALVSFSYNCGGAWMSETTGYMYNAVRNGYTGSKFLYAMGLYSSAGGSYVLMSRRFCEANMYLNGVYKAYNSGADAYPSTYKYVFLDGNGGEVRYRIYAYDAADNLPVDIAFTKIPTGTDSNGNAFAYDFAGWYTASGKLVSVLDTTLADGETLFAKWKDPDGNIVDVSRGEEIQLKVKVTGDVVNVRSGPGTSYSKVTTVQYGQELTLTELYEVGGYTWGKFSQGWIRLDYTNYDAVKPGNSFPKQGIVTASDVNYRTKPEVNSATLVGQKQKGDLVIIVEEWNSGTMLWGKMSDGYWISMNYVTYDLSAAQVVSGIQVWQKPNKTAYFQGEALDVAGGVLLVSYTNGNSVSLSITDNMVSGYDSSKVGTVQVKVTYSGKTATFPVTVLSRTATVVFKNYDGTVLSSTTYNLGDKVTPPTDPERAPEGGFTFEFVGWDKEVTDCTGDAEYTAVFRKIAPKGDLTQDGTVNNDDVTLLLWNTLFPEEYPLEVSGDLIADGSVNNDDVVLLLWHTLFPSEYPLS